MSSSYERVNYITSFGFSSRWRRQCVQRAQIVKGAVVADLMTGMGECWRPILSGIESNGNLIALDFSNGMLKYARDRKSKLRESNIEILSENVFDNSIEDESLDSIISGFGMKTFSSDQLKDFGLEVRRMLKPNGTFSFIEVSVPPNKILKTVYMFYLKHLIPLLGKLLAGNPEPYRMLGVYTERFENAREAQMIFEDLGLEVEFESYFYGCATGILGRRS